MNQAPHSFVDLQNYSFVSFHLVIIETDEADGREPLSWGEDRRAFFRGFKDGRERGPTSHRTKLRPESTTTSGIPKQRLSPSLGKRRVTITGNFGGI